MTPTKPTLLLSLALVSAVLGVALADLVDTATGRRFPVYWTTVITLAVIVALLLGWTVIFRARLRREKGRINPFVAMRTAALAMAASRFGAIVVGFFLGIGLWFAVDLTTAVSRQRLIACGVSVVCGLLLVAIALWLERICRLPEDPDEQQGVEDANLDDAGGDWVHPRS